jgi:hypothetical protein
MNIKSFFSLIGSVILFTVFSTNSFAAPGPCKGPNKNDPGCNEPAPPPPTIVNSAAVDWKNQQITVRGESLDTAVDFSLGGSVLNNGDLDVVSANELNIPFNTDVANAVTSKGNYQFNIDGADVLSLFVKSQIIATTAIGCPCENEWAAELNGLSPAEQCLELIGPDPLDNADIAGTVLSEPTDSSVYPHYPIGASFLPDDPNNSVCRLVQVNDDATSNELVNFRINETQQEECATILRNNYCDTTTTLP